MPTIFIKDSYRAAVEAATGGKRTVLYDDKGFPSVMNVIPAFRLEDIDPALGTGLHPAFVVGGVEKSEIFVGTYPSKFVDGRAVSMPNVWPDGAIFDTAKKYCADKGPGWHMLTNAEWAALALWCAKNGYKPRGNTYYGQAHNAKHETAIRGDGNTPGPHSAGGDPNPYTLAGSGPSSWNHDLTTTGIVDMVGNRYEWVDLLKLVDGRIVCPIDNNYLLTEKDWPSQAAYFDSPKEGSHDGAQQSLGAPILAGSVTKRTNEMTNGADEANADYAVGTWYNTPNATGFETPQLLKQLLIAPMQPSGVSDLSLVTDGALYVRNIGERLPLRGGDYYSTSNAGLGYLYLNNQRTNNNGGVRLAFIS